MFIYFFIYSLVSYEKGLDLATRKDRLQDFRTG